MNTYIIIAGLVALVLISQAFEKLDRKWRGKGSWMPSQWCLRFSGAAIGAAFAILCFWLTNR